MSRGLGDVYKRQVSEFAAATQQQMASAQEMTATVEAIEESVQVLTEKTKHFKT